jgi:3-oxoacyl-[acyl-carrier protein] reductase
VCEESEFTASGYVFATEGVRLALADIQSDSVEQVAMEVRDADGQARAWTLDVGDGAAIAEIAPKAAEELGGLDFVINNAGIVAPVSLDDQFWHRRLDTMLTAHQRIVRAALPYLRSSCARIVMSLPPRRWARPAERHPGPRRHHRQRDLPGSNQNRNDGTDT